MTVHCFFEQSGTFKNEFKKLGFNAIDYDIQNEFGETDCIIDLFGQIRGGGYNSEPSIFDQIKEDDLIMAFFPCIRFEDQALLLFRGEQFQQSNISDLEKLEKDLEMHKELSELYEMVTKLAMICIKRGLRLIIENPYSTCIGCGRGIVTELQLFCDICNEHIEKAYVIDGKDVCNDCLEVLFEVVKEDEL